MCHFVFFFNDIKFFISFLKFVPRSIQIFLHLAQIKLRIFELLNLYILFHITPLPKPNHTFSNLSTSASASSYFNCKASCLFCMTSNFSDSSYKPIFKLRWYTELAFSPSPDNSKKRSSMNQRRKTNAVIQYKIKDKSRDILITLYIKILHLFVVQFLQFPQMLKKDSCIKRQLGSMNLNPTSHSYSCKAIRRSSMFISFIGRCFFFEDFFGFDSDFSTLFFSTYFTLIPRICSAVTWIGLSGSFSATTCNGSVFSKNPGVQTSDPSTLNSMLSPTSKEIWKFEENLGRCFWFLMKPEYKNGDGGCSGNCMRLTLEQSRTKASNCSSVSLSHPKEFLSKSEWFES